MQLFATPLSHFSRKVRLLLDHYGAPYEVVDIGNTANADPALFHHNPLMKVPVLQDEGQWLIESDHIAAYVVRKLDAGDRYAVLTQDPQVLNVRAMMNGVMEDEVKIILAERTGLDTRPHAFFQKARAGVEGGLRWLEEHAQLFRPHAPTYLDFHLVCMWQHLKYYDLLPMPYEALHDVVAQLAADPRVRATAPEVLKPKRASA